MYNFLLKLMNPVVDEATIKMFTTKYNDNPYLAITALQKLGPKAVIEATMRAEEGKALSRPYGSNIQYSNWDSILLNPRQLFEFPTPTLEEITTKTVIGKNAKRPLFLDMPILITGMSYGGSLSLQMFKGIAIASNLAKTAMNMGESTIIDEVKARAYKVIGQYNRAGLLNDDESLKKVDAIEIQLGQGAWGGACQSITKACDIDETLRIHWKLKENEDQIFKSRLDQVQNQKQLIQLVEELKQKYDVPIGIKIAGTDFIENELQVIVQTDVDFITIDGAEGGTSEAPPTLADSVGLPTLHSLLRTIRYLEEHKIRNNYDVLIAGGLKTPSDFIKALALGADAVYIGSIAIFAAVQNQAIKALPQSPPTQLALSTGKYKDQLDEQRAGIHLNNFLQSSIEEMKMVLQVTAKKDISELTKVDLCTLDQNISTYYNIRYALNPRDL